MEGLKPPPKERQAPDHSAALSHHPGLTCNLDDLTTYASIASILLPLSAQNDPLPIRKTLFSVSPNQHHFPDLVHPDSEHRIGCGGGDIANVVVGSCSYTDALARDYKHKHPGTRLSPWPNHADPPPLSTTVRTLQTITTMATYR